MKKNSTFLMISTCSLIFISINSGHAEDFIWNQAQVESLNAVKFQIFRGLGHDFGRLYRQTKTRLIGSDQEKTEEKRLKHANLSPFWGGLDEQTQERSETYQAMTRIINFVVASRIDSTDNQISITLYEAISDLEKDPNDHNTLVRTQEKIRDSAFNSFKSVIIFETGLKNQELMRATKEMQQSIFSNGISVTRYIKRLRQSDAVLQIAAQHHELFFGKAATLEEKNHYRALLIQGYGMATAQSAIAH